jgi:hypothetical protein
VHDNINGDIIDEAHMNEQAEFEYLNEELSAI